MNNKLEIKDFFYFIPEWWEKLLQYWLEDYIEVWWKLEDIKGIKEKFWILRFEWNNQSYILEWIERASQYICEKCWDTWKIRCDLPRFKTLCETHYQFEKNKIIEWLADDEYAKNIERYEEQKDSDLLINLIYND